MIELWRAVAEPYSAGDTQAEWQGRWQTRERAERQARRWLEDDGLDSVWLESVEIPDDAIVRHEDLSP